MEIPFSPQNPGTWVALDISDLDRYITIKYHSYTANEAVKSGGQLPFHPIAFKNAHLLEIVNQPDCKHIAFSHLLIQDQNKGQHSTLLAYGLLFDEIIGNMYIGTPTEMPFGSDLLEEAKILLKNSTRGFTWTCQEANSTPITDWLAKPKNQGRFQKGVDFLVRVRIDKNEAKTFLEGYNPNSLIVFYPGVFKCEVDRTITTSPDNTGDYCNLIIYGQHPNVSIPGNKKHTFFICSDAWRPNWRKQSILNLFFEYLSLSFSSGLQKIKSLFSRSF